MKDYKVIDLECWESNNSLIIPTWSISSSLMNTNEAFIYYLEKKCNKCYNKKQRLNYKISILSKFKSKEFN